MILTSAQLVHRVEMPSNRFFKGSVISSALADL